MSLLKRLFGKKDSEEQKAKKRQITIQTLKINGVKAMRIGRAEQALAFFHQILELEKEDKDAMLYLSQCYVQLNELELAKEYIQKVCLLAPDLVEPQLSRIHIFQLNKEYQQMLVAATQLVESHSDLTTAHYIQAVAYYKLDELFQAIASLTRAITLNTYHTESLYLRAKILLEMNQVDEALQDIQQILEREKDHEGALLLKGSIEEKKGLSNEAYETYTKLINLNPFCSKAYSQLAKYYIHQRLLGQALDVLNEAIELNPNDANLYQHRGSVKLIMNDKDGAFDDTKKALELDPTIKESISGEFRS